MSPRPSLFTSMPALLGTPWAVRADSLEQLESLLLPRHRIRDLDALNDISGSDGRFRMEAATGEVGDIGLTSIWGSAMTLSVEPIQPVCMLALPAIGWGRYRLERDRIDNVFGETIAFLPARGWSLTNNGSGGTGLHFSEQALARRVRAMQGDGNALDVSAAVSAPRSLPLANRRIRAGHQQLLHALAMLDANVRLGLGAPSPMLRLDDLILRCIALLLFPRLAQAGAGGARAEDRDLRREVLRLMEWIQAHLHTPISLSDIEQRSVYGRRSLQAGFKAEVGSGPMQWLRRQRLEQARQRLLDPQGPLQVHQVAQACGYLNPSAFSRDFRARFGLSPRQLQREAGDDPQP